MPKGVCWPAYLETRTPIRTLGYDLGGRILTEHGEYIDYNTWSDLREILAPDAYNMILLTEDMMQYVKAGAVEDKSVRVLASERGHINSISIRYGRHRRIIAPAQAWCELYGPEMLPAIRETFTHCQVGDRPTPSGLGQAIARKVWATKKLKWHWAPPQVVQEALYENSASPRTETPGMGWKGEEAWEYDLNSAYANYFRSHPAGKVLNILEGDHDWYESTPTWFRLCVVGIPSGLDMSPVPLRRSDGGWSYNPIGPRTTLSWMWKEQAECAREVGIRVYPDKGWAWFRMTEDNSHVSDELLNLKENAPNELVRMFVKRAIVTFIGRHAMRADTYRVVDYVDSERPEDCRPLFDRTYRNTDRDNPFTSYYLALESKSRGGMIHWQRYTVMKTNQALFKMGSKDIASLLMTNFDAVISTTRLPWTPAGWKEIKLTNVSIPYARAIISDQKIKTPGRRAILK